MNEDKVRVAITQGDTNGIGYEIIFKTFQDPAMFEVCVPIIYGAPKVAAYHIKEMNLAASFNLIHSASEAVEGKLNLVSCIDEEVKVDFGHPTKESGNASFMALEKAITEYKDGLFDVLVTAPICKSAIQNDIFRFPGHTEYLQKCLADNGQEALMILMNDLMRVALVTIHVPIREVADAVTFDNIKKKIQLLQHSLLVDFRVSAPRIAVLALNPHAGDCGLIGKEEQEIIKSAIEDAVNSGIQCFGPYPADGFFGDASYRHFDAVLAMYHDQGLAPFKALSMSDGVNYTAGLPLVRTSPDHGTAYDIAGKGIADESSFRHAIYSAIDIFRCRRDYKKASANPLRNEYQNRKD